MGMVFSSLLQQVIILVGEDEGDDNVIILMMDHLTIGVMIMAIMRVILTQVYQQ